MAATHEVAPDALPYFDQGYDDPGVREMVRLQTKPKVNRLWLFHPVPQQPKDRDVHLMTTGFRAKYKTCCGLVDCLLLF